MPYLILILVVAAAIYFAYAGRHKEAQFAQQAVQNGSAFAKLAEADGKLIALKAATEVKKAEADAAHAALDEVHSILG